MVVCPLSIWGNTDFIVELRCLGNRILNNSPFETWPDELIGSIVDSVHRIFVQVQIIYYCTWCWYFHYQTGLSYRDGTLWPTKSCFFISCELHPIWAIMRSTWVVTMHRQQICKKTLMIYESRDLSWNCIDETWATLPLTSLIEYIISSPIVLPISKGALSVMPCKKNLKNAISTLSTWWE